MRVFAIGDLHLSQAAEKPMDLFGERWLHHASRLAQRWSERVGPEDLVLIPGDISWAMHLREALPDFAFIDALPGRKLLLRGNHDYWWSSLSKVNAALPPGMRAIQNNAVVYPGFSVGGTRGWTCPGGQGFTPEDEKIYLREAGRLELSIKDMPEGKPKLIMMHFPPFTEKNGDTAFTRLLTRAGVDTVVYGHLHGSAHKLAFQGEREGVDYVFVSGDYLDFAPRLIWEFPHSPGEDWFA